MRFERAELSALAAELDVPAEGGRRRWRRRRGIRVELHLGGALGLGDAAPLPDYSPESYYDTEWALRAFCAAPPELSDDLPLPLAVERWLASVPEALPAARFALETALLDLRSRLEGVPVHVLLGGPAPRYAGVAALLGAANVEHTLARAGEASDAGATALKLKFVDDGDWPRVEALRHALPDLPLRLDFNRGLRADKVDETLALRRAIGRERASRRGALCGVGPRRHVRVLRPAHLPR